MELDVRRAQVVGIFHLFRSNFTIGKPDVRHVLKFAHYWV